MDESRRIIELQLLSTMLDRGEFAPVIEGEVDRDHFHTSEGQAVFDFIVGYRHLSDGRARFPSLAVVRSRFKNSPWELPTPTPGDSVESLVYETKMHAARTEVLDIAACLETCAKDNTLDPLEEVMPSIARLRKLTDQVKKDKHVSLAEAFGDVLIDYDCGAILKDGIDWPWQSMTEATRGIHSQEFLVIAGRPKARKTFVAIKMCAHAVMQGARVLFVTPEMPPRQILLRFIAMLAELHYTEFKNGALEQAEFSRLIEAAQRYGKLVNEDDVGYAMRMHKEFPDQKPGTIPSFDVVQGTNRTVGWIESQIELYKPDIVVVDSFYRLANEGGRKSDADWKVVTQISRALKDLAMSTNVALIGTHQMNRDAESKIGSTGNMALADAVGQDADLILRVITGKMDGEDHSALFVIGGRETPHDGVIIKNKPCYDFSEVGVITSRKVVEKLLRSEDEEEEKDEEGGKERPAASLAQKRKSKKNMKKPVGMANVEQQDEEDIIPDEALEDGNAEAAE